MNCEHCWNSGHKEHVWWTGKGCTAHSVTWVQVPEGHGLFKEVFCGHLQERWGWGIQHHSYYRYCSPFLAHGPMSESKEQVVYRKRRSPSHKGNADVWAVLYFVAWLTKSHKLGLGREFPCPYVTQYGTFGARWLAQGAIQGTLSLKLNVFSLASGTVSAVKHRSQVAFWAATRNKEELEGRKTTSSDDIVRGRNN